MVEEVKNLQKQYMKNLCYLIYISGLGDCWYEETRRSKINKILYTLWAVFFNFYLTIVIFNVSLNYFLRNDLTYNDYNEINQCVVGQLTVYIKFILFISQRQKIKDFFKKMFESQRVIYNDNEKCAVIKTNLYIGISAVSTIFCIGVATFRGYRAYVRTGVYLQMLRFNRVIGHRVPNKIYLR